MFNIILKATTSLSVAVTFAITAAPVFAQDSVMFNYQGRVKVQGKDYNGDGQFKFAILSPDQSSVLWTNDGSSNQGIEPTVGVNLSVENGVFNVVMGASGIMEPINSTIFQNREPLKLRTWFNDGIHGFEAMQPDHNLINVNLITSETGGSDFTIFVNGETGNDSNSGLKVTEAKKTIQAAIDIVPSRVMANLTIDVADGIYREELTLFGISVKPGKVMQIKGDESWTPANGGLPSVTISGSDGTTTGVLDTLVTGVQCSGVELFGLCIEGAKINGIVFENGKYSIKSCVSRFNAGGGFVLTTQAFSNTKNFLCNNNTGNGISINTQSRMFMELTSANNNGGCGLFAVDSSTANFLTSGSFDNNGSTGIYIIGASQAGFDNNYVGTARNNKNYGLGAGWYSYIHNWQTHLTLTGNLPANILEFKGGQVNW